MGGLEDFYQVLKGVIKYSNIDTIKEFPHFFHDLTLGAKIREKRPNYLYADLHTHIRRTESIKEVIREASKRVDVLALTTRVLEANKGHLDFKGALEKLEQEEMNHKSLGKKVVEVYLENGRKFYLIRSTEVYVRENQGIVMVGNERDFFSGELNMDDAVKVSRDMGALWFLDHPFTVGFKSQLGFRYPTEEEMKMREGWFDIHVPVIETGNHQNTLHMYPSNVLAKKMARKHDLASICNSDSHFRVKEVGLSRTGIPAELLDDSSEESFLSSLRNVFSLDNRARLHLESGYSSIWSFGRYMMYPKLKGLMRSKWK